MLYRYVVILVTNLGGYPSPVANIVYLACGVMLLVMALMTAMTGARTPMLLYKICPLVKTAVVILFILGSVL